MAGGNLSPRQKMINMMYLVLMALLALNVSKEVLNAFGLVSQGIQNTITSIDSKNSAIYEAFQGKLEENPEETQKLYDWAIEAQSVSNDLSDYLAEIREAVVQAGGGWNEDEGGEAALQFAKRDDIDAASRLLADDGPESRGDELKQKILDGRAAFLKILEEATADDPTVSFEQMEKNISLNAVDHVDKGKKTKWKVYNFYHVPVIAAHTILTKYQNDVKSAETIVIEYLINRIGKFKIKFDQLRAQVMAKSGYVMQGSKYEADIFIGASSKSADPEIYIGNFSSAITRDENGALEMYHTDSENDVPLVNGGTKLEEIAGGIGKYERTASSVGQQKYQGVIKIVDPKGGWQYYPFENEFQVGAKSVVVSPIKMNVFYIGVDNPVEISVPGVSQKDIMPSIDVGNIKPGPDGTYIVTCKSTDMGKKANISVTAKIDGSNVPMGSKEFRVKIIPDPVPTLGGTFKGGPISRSKLSQMGGIVPDLGQFDFDVKFTVMSFTMALTLGENVFKKTGVGPLLTSDMTKLIGQGKKGNYVIFDDIKVKGPDGNTRKLPTISAELL